MKMMKLINNNSINIKTGQMIMKNYLLHHTSIGLRNLEIKVIIKGGMGVDIYIYIYRLCIYI